MTPFAARHGGLLAAAVLAAATPNLARAAKPTGVAAAFGNTIVSTYPDGRQAHLWLNKDGSYTAEGRRKDPSSGRWTLKDAKICLRQAHPAALPISYCTALPTGGVGSSWKAKAVTGDPITVKLVKGRAKPA